MRLPTFYELFLIPNWGIDSFIAKVRDIKFKAKVDDADIEKLTDDRKKLIENESKLLEDLAKTEHSHPLGMVVSTHFRCGKGVKRGLKNGALPFNID